jgi:hypothetical protein
MERAASSRERDVAARGRAPSGAPANGACTLLGVGIATHVCSAKAFRFEMMSLIRLIAVVVIAANAVVLALAVRSEYRRWRSDDPR